jgi:hypothetical protein
MNAGVRTGSSGLFTLQLEGNDKYEGLVVGLSAMGRQKSRSRLPDATKRFAIRRFFVELSGWSRWSTT